MQAAMSSSLVERRIVIEACFLICPVTFTCDLSRQSAASSDFYLPGWPIVAVNFEKLPVFIKYNQ